MFLLLIVINVSLLAISLLYTYKRSILLTPWLVVFTCIWIIPVGISVYYDGIGAFEYAFSAYSSLLIPGKGSNVILSLMVMLLFTSILMLLSTFFSDKLFRKRSNGNSIKSKEIGYKVETLFTIWCIVCLIILSFNGFPWYYVFFPTYASGDIYVNYILRTMYLIVPIYSVYLAMASGRKRIIFVVLFWALIVSLSTGQRRNFLVFVLFSIYLYSYFKYGEFNFSKLMSFKKYLLTFVLSFSMVIVLWVFRVVATNYLQLGSIINPFENRSVFDIIFGSGATGVATGYVIVDWVEKEMFLPFYNVFYGITQIIPRGLWDNKPVGLDSIIQNYYSLDVSPSVFWFGDYLLSFGLYLFPIGIIVFAFFISFIQNILVRKDKSLYVILSALIFSNSFTFYKNGFGMFLATLFTSFIIVIFCHLICNLRFHNISREIN